MEHLTQTQRDTITASIRVTYEYVLEFASDADVFLLHGALSQHAGQIAHHLSQVGEGMLPPAPSPYALADQGNGALSRHV